MSQYEVTFITKEDQKEKPVKKDVESLDGKILNIATLGQKSMAYPIKKEKTGVYTTIVLEMAPEKVLEFNRKLSLNPEILRHIILTAVAVKTLIPSVSRAKQAEVKIPDKAIEPIIEKGITEIEKPSVEKVPEEPKKVAKKAAPEKPKVAKPAIKVPAPRKTTEEVSTEDRLKALDKKLEELLKE